MGTEIPKRFKLQDFFEEVVPYADPGRDFVHWSQRRRGIFELGTAYEGRIVRFYDYAEWGGSY